MHILLCLGEERQQQFHHRLGDTAAGRDFAMRPCEVRKHMAVTRTMKSARAGLGLKLAKVQDIRKGERMVMNRVCACVGADLAGI